MDFLNALPPMTKLAVLAIMLLMIVLLFVTGRNR